VRAGSTFAMMELSSNGQWARLHPMLEGFRQAGLWSFGSSPAMRGLEVIHVGCFRQTYTEVDWAQPCQSSFAGLRPCDSTSSI